MVLLVALGVAAITLGIVAVALARPLMMFTMLNGQSSTRARDGTYPATTNTR